MSTIEFEIHSNKSDDVNISLDKNNHSVDYLKKVISKKLKIKNQEQISSITLNYDGK
jgi:hypothetical protein